MFRVGRIATGHFLRVIAHISRRGIYVSSANNLYTSVDDHNVQCTKTILDSSLFTREELTKCYKFSSQLVSTLNERQNQRIKRYDFHVLGLTSFTLIPMPLYDIITTLSQSGTTSSLDCMGICFSMVLISGFFKFGQHFYTKSLSPSLYAQAQQVSVLLKKKLTDNSLPTNIT